VIGMQIGQCVLIKDDVNKVLYEIKSINNVKRGSAEPLFF